MDNSKGTARLINRSAPAAMGPNRPVRAASLPGVRPSDFPGPMANRHQEPPRLSCPPLEKFSPSDWNSVASAFAMSPAVNLGQSWREPQDSFRPATIRTGWRAGKLWVYAELDDDDIFNPSGVFNEPFFLHGDALEIFLRPAGQSAYFEFHVGPAGQLFQLRIPSAEAFARQAGTEAGSWKIRKPVINVRTRVDRERGRWFVLAAIQREEIVEKGGSPGEWMFSFSRYDHTHGENCPVLSSTSPHAKLGFHRQQEWGCLRFY